MGAAQAVQPGAKLGRRARRHELSAAHEVAAVRDAQGASLACLVILGWSSWASEVYVTFAPEYKIKRDSRIALRGFKIDVGMLVVFALLFIYGCVVRAASRFAGAGRSGPIRAGPAHRPGRPACPGRCLVGGRGGGRWLAPLRGVRP
jgi:hypothetical protein